MVLEDKTLFENLLGTDDNILWVGRPLTKAFTIRNIEQALIDSVKTAVFVIIIFSLYYLILHQEFIPKEEISNLTLYLIVILILNMVIAIKKVIQAGNIRYCITDNQVIIFNLKTRQNETFEKSHINKKEIYSSVTDREYNVQTIKLLIENEEGDILIESIENGDKVLELL